MTIDSAVSYSPTRQSLQAHILPAWFDEAKLGILIHWGPSSVPGWAPTAKDPGVPHGDWSGWFAANPYSEWYRNSIQIPGSPSQQHHVATYGEGYPYENFAASFNEVVQGWDPAPWADLFHHVGARYVVLVTKHHDGFLLWPSAQPNPHRENYFCPRDVVSELAAAVRARGMRMGLYYSGGLDWTWEPRPIRDLADMLAAIPLGPEYAAYVEGHWRELIDHYRPDILWNDIAYPSAANLRALLASYYNQVPEGVVNDRFQQFAGGARLRRWLDRPLTRRFVAALAGRVIEWRLSPAAAARRRRHGEQFDFLTPEYRLWPAPSGAKWECVRGLGRSFGYNRAEGPEAMLSVTALVHLLVDIVSKGGNLLLGVGPAADGTIPDVQRERLLGLGQWLAVNGEAIFGTRPWGRAARQTTAEGLPVRFTLDAHNLYAIVLGHPTGRHVTVAVDCPMMSAYLLGDPMMLSWEQTLSGIRIALPEDLPDAPAYTIRLRRL